MAIVFAEYTNKGDREINEDSIGHIANGDNGFFVLADGLGGHGGGEIASQLVVNKAKEYYKKNPDDISGCFVESQNALVSEQRAKNAFDELKTTMVCLSIHDGKALWGHVGDSRLYHFVSGKICGRTFDHSVPQMLAKIGEIREKDIRGHVDRNRLIRVLGMEWNEPKYELSNEIVLCGNDTFLLCSDGFWELITESEMEKALKRAVSPDQWIEMMSTKILKNGTGRNMDNFSAIAVYGK